MLRLDTFKNFIGEGISSHTSCSLGTPAATVKLTGSGPAPNLM